jgi:hypothetical protein
MGRHTVAVPPGWALSSRSIRRIDLQFYGDRKDLPRIGVEYLLSVPPSGHDEQRFNELISKPMLSDFVHCKSFGFHGFRLFSLVCTSRLAQLFVQFTKKMSLSTSSSLGSLFQSRVRYLSPL